MPKHGHPQPLLLQASGFFGESGEPPLQGVKALEIGRSCPWLGRHRMGKQQASGRRTDIENKTPLRRASSATKPGKFKRVLWKLWTRRDGGVGESQKVSCEQGNWKWNWPVPVHADYYASELCKMSLIVSLLPSSFRFSLVSTYSKGFQGFLLHLLASILFFL